MPRAKTRSSQGVLAVHRQRRIFDHLTESKSKDIIRHVRLYFSTSYSCDPETLA